MSNSDNQLTLGISFGVPLGPPATPVTSFIVQRDGTSLILLRDGVSALLKAHK